MAVETFTTFPASFFAGDTVRLSLSDGDFPSSAWELSVVFRAPDGTATAFDASAGASDTFDLVIPASGSAALAAGIYTVTLVYTETATSERETSTQSYLVTVFADPTATVAKSVAKQTLEAMEAAMLKLAAGVNATVNFNGQSFTKRNIKELQDAIERQRAIVLREDRLINGGPRKLFRVLARL